MALRIGESDTLPPPTALTPVRAVPDDTTSSATSRAAASLPLPAGPVLSVSILMGAAAVPASWKATGCVAALVDGCREGCMVVVFKALVVVVDGSAGSGVTAVRPVSLLKRLMVR